MIRPGARSPVEIFWKFSCPLQFEGDEARRNLTPLSEDARKYFTTISAEKGSSNLGLPYEANLISEA